MVSGSLLFLIGLLSFAMAALWPFTAIAERPVISRIGVLIPPLSESQLNKVLVDSLGELGYVLGKNVQLVLPMTRGGNEALNKGASELSNFKVDLIIAVGSPATRAALDATKTIPIVFTSGDPVTAGFVESLSRPGGNATGVSVLSFDFYAKCVEFLHEIAPRAKRIAFLHNPSNPLANRDRKLRTAAEALGMVEIVIGARTKQELEVELQSLQRKKVDAVIVSGEIFYLRHMMLIADSLRKCRLPACYAYREYQSAEVLMSYGPSLKEMIRYVASYADKIIRGATPSALPIEQITKYEFLINLRVARELDLQVPQELLLRADEVIR
jgi:putative ABC transport system substrate-binding protein